MNQIIKNFIEVAMFTFAFVAGSILGNAQVSAQVNQQLGTTGATPQNHFSGPRNMGPILNSASDDQGGAITPNGLSFYFASSRPVGSLGGIDIWVSHRPTPSSPWGAPLNLGSTVNSQQNDLVPSFSPDGLSMFFTSDRPASPGGLTDIYLTTRPLANDDFGWTTPINLGPNINTSFSERGATYFENPTTGKGTLIFAREPVIPPAPPFHDLYESTRNADGSFNAPTPIDELNSVGSEIRAMVRSDGLEVFIHSAREGGLSPAPPAAPTFDIFVSTRLSTASPWSTPVLVPGINTPFTEGGPVLSPDGSIIYFQSNRPGTLGGNDLYSATRCSIYSDAPCAVNRGVADFDADGKTDLSVFRPSDGSWWVFNSGTKTVSARQFGSSGDKPVAADYDGDNRLDLAVFRPSTGSWWILRSSDSTYYVVNFGLSTDRLVAGDYDFDGKTDEAVFRDGEWYVLRSSDEKVEQHQFGVSGDLPIAE